MGGSKLGSLLQQGSCRCSNKRIRVAGTSFDIYKSSKGYVTISNDVQRAILAALLEGEKSFPELVEAAGRSKPTVSLQLKDMAAQGLVLEQTAPEDRRRRSYRSLATRIGSSDLPVADLSSAVKDYVAKASEPMVRLPLVLESLASCGASPTASWKQARHLGPSLVQQMDLDGEGGAWMRLARFLERAGLARTLVIDVEENKLDCELSANLRGPVEGLAAALGGLVEGAWVARGAKGIGSSLEGRRVKLWQK